MDFTIHYSGQLSKLENVYEIIDELKDIAEIRNWSYTVLDDDWNTPPTAHLESSNHAGIQIKGHCGLKGIQFKPHIHCDSIWLYFNHKGFLTTPFQVALDAEEGYPQRINPLFVKTQNAGFETHILIVNLFKYLQKKFFPTLIVKDETNFWTHGNKVILKELFKANNFAASSENTNSATPVLDPTLQEDIEMIAKKIEELLRNIIEDSDPEI